MEVDREVLGRLIVVDGEVNSDVKMVVYGEFDMEVDR